MKPLMLLYLSIFLSCISIKGNAQSVNFSYDACGNRIHQLYVEKEQKKDTGDSTYFSHDLLISNVVPDIIVFQNPTKEFIIVKSKEI